MLGSVPLSTCLLSTLPALLARSRTYLQRARQLWAGLLGNLERHADCCQGSDAVGARRTADQLAGMTSIGSVKCG